MWDLVEGELKQSWRAHSKAVSGLCVNARKESFVSCSFDGDVSAEGWVC
jgi:hypothetical protein